MEDETKKQISMMIFSKLLLKVSSEVQTDDDQREELSNIPDGTDFKSVSRIDAALQTDFVDQLNTDLDLQLS